MVKWLIRGQRGIINIAGLVMMGIGMVFLAVGFIVYPIVTTATDSILAWSYTAYTHTSITDAYFTGLTQVVGIVPLLVLIGFVTAGAITGFMGYKVASGGATASTTNPGSMMMLGIGIIFIAVGLIMFPVVLDGTSSALTAKNAITETDTLVTDNTVGYIGNITLNKTLWNGAVAEVTSVTSNVSETPVADNYSDPKLYLTGVTQHGTRTITTVYNYPSVLDGDYTGLLPILKISPILVLVAFITVGIVAGFFGIKTMGKG